MVSYILVKRDNKYVVKAVVTNCYNCYRNHKREITENIYKSTFFHKFIDEGYSIYCKDCSSQRKHNDYDTAIHFGRRTGQGFSTTMIPLDWMEKNFQFRTRKGRRR